MLKLSLTDCVARYLKFWSTRIPHIASHSITAVWTFGTMPKPNLRWMSHMNIRPKMKLAKTAQVVVFGTETEFRSVSVHWCWAVCVFDLHLLHYWIFYSLSVECVLWDQIVGCSGLSLMPDLLRVTSNWSSSLKLLVVIVRCVSCGYYIGIDMNWRFVLCTAK